MLMLACMGSKTTKAGGSQLTDQSSSSKNQSKQKEEPVEVVTSTDLPTLLAKASEYQKNGKYRKAAAYLSKAKELKPDDTDLRMQLITAYHQAEKFDQEISELNELLQIKPENSLRLTYAKRLHEAQRFDEAINAIEDIRAVDPENIEALIVLGALHKDQAQYAEAIEIFREITYIDAKNAHAKYYQAEVYLAQKKPLWADKYYKDALKLDPTLGVAVFGLAKIAQIRNSQEDYKKHLAKAYELDPEHSEIKKAFLNQ